MTLNTCPSGVIYHACTSTSQHTKFEIPSLNHSKDMTEAQEICIMRPDQAPFRDEFIELSTVIHGYELIKFDVSISTH